MVRSALSGDMVRTMRRPTDRPNIVLINCDDLGYGDLGCYGSTRNATPGIDRLAARGIRLTDFYQGAAVCTPSRAAMLTGCYPRRVGMDVFDHGNKVLFPGDAIGLDPSEQTLGSMLKDAGYATAMIGKWHVGDQPEFLPTRHGFDRSFGLPYSNDMGRQVGDRKTFPPLPLVEGDAQGEWIVELQPDQSSLTERYVEHAVRFMRAHRDGPFFLYLAHLHVHLPHYAPEVFLRASTNGRYGAAVLCIDWATRVIHHELRALGLEHNTIVIFTSDNGSRVRDEGGSNAPLRGVKGTNWEGGIRVPAIVSWPGQLSEGMTCGAMCTAMDFLPTLARLSGGTLAPAGPIDGVDLTSVLERPEMAASPHDRFLYYERDRLEAIRSGDLKLHLRTGELYDLRTDIGEQRDIATERPDDVRTLTDLADGVVDELGDALANKPGTACRPPGRVDSPQPLAEHDSAHPYLIEMYDLPECG